MPAKTNRFLTFFSTYASALTRFRGLYYYARLRLTTFGMVLLVNALLNLGWGYWSVGCFRTSSKLDLATTYLTYLPFVAFWGWKLRESYRQNWVGYILGLPATPTAASMIS